MSSRAGKLFEIELPRDPSAASKGRQQIARWFSEALEDEQLQVATLLTSELVTNALQHGDGRIMLRAGVDPNRLLVEVMDEGGGFEHTIRQRGFEDVEGWGLRFVEMQSTRWGTHEGTTHVWFELERPGPRLGSGESPLDPGSRG